MIPEAAADNRRMTLTEFLEARIADDERANDQDVDPVEWCDRVAGTHYEHARIAAECAAKRFILIMHKTYAQAASERTGIAAFGAECGRDVTADVLKPIAAVYSSHPDYDQEWAL